MRCLRGERIWDTQGTIPPRTMCIIKCDSSGITSAWLLTAGTRGCWHSWCIMSTSLRLTQSWVSERVEIPPNSDT